MGVSTKANIPTGSSAHFCRMGTANATVFPEPVLLPPMQSLPFNISGMQSFWMPVGLFIAMAPNECTSQGFTVKAEKVVVVSTGASIPALLVDDVLICDFVFTRDVRDGTESLGTRGTSISEGETFLRFREAWESRESESETSPSDSDEEVECSCSDEADASSDVGLIICDLRAFSAAIEFQEGGCRGSLGNFSYRLSHQKNFTVREDRLQWGRAVRVCRAIKSLAFAEGIRYLKHAESAS